MEEIFVFYIRSNVASPTRGLLLRAILSASMDEQRRSSSSKGSAKFSENNDFSLRLYIGIDQTAEGFKKDGPKCLHQK
jgi:hypothetical protein